MGVTAKQKLALVGVGVLAAAGAAAALASIGHGHAAASPRSAGTFVSISAGRGSWGGAAHLGGRMGMHGGDDLAAAASYLGVSTAQLEADLQSGKTLAQIAAATSGRSAAGLIAALVAHAKQELSAAVTAGKLTQAQADAISAGIEQRVTAMVNGTPPAAGMGRMHDGWPGMHDGRPGMPGGFGPDGARPGGANA